MSLVTSVLCHVSS